MRIGIDIGKALGRRDGIASYTRGLLSGLAAVDRENQYRLYSLLEPATAQQIAAALPDLPPNFTCRAERRPRPGDLDLFHATTYTVPAGWDGRLVFTLHDLTFLSLPDCHTLANRVHCLRGTVRAVHQARAVIAVSEQTRRDAAAWLDLAGERVVVVPNAADERFAAAARARQADGGGALRAALAERFDLAGPYVLAVGTLEPRKNFGALLAAWRELPAELGAAFRLAIAGGSGWLAGDLAAEVEAAGLAGRVRLLGYVEDPDLPPLLAHAEVFAYPSLYEGFGLPVLEAMAAGVPVVTSGVSALPEVVGEAGVLVDPSDPGSIRDGLASLLADPARRRELARAGEARAALYSWRRTATETLAVYRR